MQLERKKTKEIYILDFKDAMTSGCCTATRGVSFIWNDVIMVTESSLIRNCTVVRTTYSEFTINEHYDIVDGEWKAFLESQKLGIDMNEHD